MHSLRPCPGPSRRDVFKFGSVAVASRRRSARWSLTGSRRRPHHQRPRGHLRLAPRRAAAPGNVRHEAGRPGGVSRRVPADPRPTSPASTICEHLPRLAQCADRFSLIRSIAHKFADHGGGHKRFLTGRDPKQPTGFVNDTPMVGSMAAEVLKRRNAGVPNYVAVVDGGRQGIDVFSFGSAYLGPQSHPFIVVGDPADDKFEVKNLSPVAGTQRTARATASRC